MSKYYPINLVLDKKKCLVIGAGKVAERKVQRLLECGAHVVVIGPLSTAGIKALAKKKKIIFKQRAVTLKDLKDVHLVVAATTDRKINALVSSYCRKKDILINVVDSPKECSFIVPSVIRRGDLSISISTEGLSPAFAKKIRQDIEQRFGAEYGALLRVMKEIRPLAIKKIKNIPLRMKFFQKAMQPKILKLLKQNKEKLVKRKLKRILEGTNI